MFRYQFLYFLEPNRQFREKFEKSEFKVRSYFSTKNVYLLALNDIFFIKNNKQQSEQFLFRLYFILFLAKK